VTAGALSPRREAVLKAIVQTHIASGQPVSSKVVAHQTLLGVSPATVRNDMAVLEAKGYIRRPHPSAGGIPSSLGYRYYVDYLAEPVELPETVRQRLRKRLAAHRDLEMWGRLAAVSLADLLQSMAVSVLPRVKPVRLRHLEMIALKEGLALVVVVLEDAVVRKEILSMEHPLSPQDLEQMAGRLNTLLRGLGRREIALLLGRLSPLERPVARTVLRLLRRAEAEEAVDWAVEGLAYLLNHPDVADLDQVRGLVHMVERGRLTHLILALAPEHGLRVIIGEENPEDILHPFSLVLAPYGAPHTPQGYLALVAPTRMAYPHAMAGMGFLVSLLTHLVSSLHPRPSLS
jgi:heat-inducible transcriptional repressor